VQCKLVGDGTLDAPCQDEQFDVYCNDGFFCDSSLADPTCQPVTADGEKCNGDLICASNDCNVFDQICSPTCQ